MKRFIFSLLLAILLHGLFFFWGERWFPARAPQRTPAVPLTLALAPVPVPAPAPPVVKEPEPPKAPPRRSEPVVSPAPPVPAKPPPRKTDRPPKPQPAVKPPVPVKRPAAVPPPVPQPPPPAEPFVERRPAPAEAEAHRPPSQPVDGNIPDTAAPSPPTEAVTSPPPDPAPTPSANRTEPPSTGDREAVPMYRENPAPEYPRIARKRKYEGTVVLSVKVTREGRAAEITIDESSGYSILDRAAAAAVESWRFAPGTRGNRPVEMWVKIPIRFQIEP